MGFHAGDSPFFLLLQSLLLINLEIQILPPSMGLPVKSAAGVFKQRLEFAHGRMVRSLLSRAVKPDLLEIQL